MLRKTLSQDSLLSLDYRWKAKFRLSVSPNKVVILLYSTFIPNIKYELTNTVSHILLPTLNVESTMSDQSRLSPSSICTLNIESLISCTNVVSAKVPYSMLSPFGKF